MSRRAFSIPDGCEPLYFFYDCETTGLDPRTDSVIEIAAMVYSKALSRHRVRRPEFQSLCYTDHKLSAMAKQLTGLTNEDLQGEPPLREVLHEFFGWIQQTVRNASEREGRRYIPVLASHSGPKLDFPMIFNAVEKAGPPLQTEFDDLNLHYVDTFNVFKRLQSTGKYPLQLRKLGLSHIYQAYFAESADAHRALKDAKHLCKIFSDAPPADVFVAMLRGYVQDKDGMSFMKEQVSRFALLMPSNCIKGNQVIDLLHKGISYEDMLEKSRKSDRDLRSFLAGECGFARPKEDLVRAFRIQRLH